MLGAILQPEVVIDTEIADTDAAAGVGTVAAGGYPVRGYI